MNTSLFHMIRNCVYNNNDVKNNVFDDHADNPDNQC